MKSLLISKTSVFLATSIIFPVTVMFTKSFFFPYSLLIASICFRSNTRSVAEVSRAEGSGLAAEICEAAISEGLRICDP
jgi:hypothetical protein